MDGPGSLSQHHWVRLLRAPRLGIFPHDLDIRVTVWMTLRSQAVCRQRWRHQPKRSCVLLDLFRAAAWVIMLSKSKEQFQWWMSSFWLLAVTVLACHLCSIPLDAVDEAGHLAHLDRYWSRNVIGHFKPKQKDRNKPRGDLSRKCLTKPTPWGCFLSCK